MSKKVIVTGGAGFIGSYLVESLVRRGDEVIVIDTLLRGNKIPHEILENVEFLKVDVRDKDQLLKLGKGVDVVYHLAAILGVDIVAENPVETMDTEVQGMYAVAQMAEKYGIPKIVYASTSGVYGHNALERSVTEDLMIDPKTSYAMAKRFNEIYLGALHEEKGINTIALRFFNVYGHRQDKRMVIPRFFDQAKNNEPISVFGDGNQTRDFTWIDDTIKSSIMLGDNVNGFEIFNIANEKEVRIGELAEKIIHLTGSESKIELVHASDKRYDYEVGRRFGSSKKLFDHIGYKPETSIDEGLGAIHQWLDK
jgi:nucleoside-diphosphate-sugar epimerase